MPSQTPWGVYSLHQANITHAQEQFYYAQTVKKTSENYMQMTCSFINMHAFTFFMLLHCRNLFVHHHDHAQDQCSSGFRICPCQQDHTVTVTYNLLTFCPTSSQNSSSFTSGPKQQLRLSGFSNSFCFVSLFFLSFFYPFLLNMSFFFSLSPNLLCSHFLHSSLPRFYIEKHSWCSAQLQ